ncbi:PEP-CTERM sorting domain-containing protein [Limnoraphis robusta Tam1]|uniref:PEP-CTERM sorting domain-containing protein n=1 Tax=Limnoraphis robusta CCNP1315 TaxID=3110306 RepID=A0ABU5TXW7_9CYAN|nr:PEP-CTERM sorting domain-containing protein [Limnoraphis robusta]MEA5501368.1 PEP-CTERM sorting domain-containing protein [Limnoraphis robusta BA-68 BA1]MEA5519486.1 PEP-CTERM sorting domain-containing protein [Limnoraphis robusta CCNP1315]MEA5541838.1 PEP-CTERM sorting domain-containing protein [Limnoraphis robusta Tam1]MEA5548046.1 PEP-CTERM sorting domain-containing protein [Limnoraphis robusta CCNP1324]
MTNLFQNFALTTAAVTTAIVVFDIAPAEAYFINLSGTIDSGDLTGATYDGSFRFDTINPGGTSDINDLSVNFTFNTFTNTFTEADAISQPLVEFDDFGNLLGLDFAVDDASLGEITFNFSFVPGFFSAEDAAVFYDVENGDGGAGNVALASTDVPEPLTILGSGMALGFGALFKREQAKKRDKSASK